MRYKIAASLVCGDMLNLGRDIKQIEAGGCDYIHFDVMDGLFVPRYGLHPEILTATKAISSLPVDVHLMVQDPERYVKTFVDAGADVVTVHAEACQHLHRTLKIIRQLGVKAGVALNHSTSLGVFDYILDDVDLICLMAINPGIVGHKLIPSAIGKISDLKKRLGEKYKDIIIQVDGGVTFESAATMVANGANLLVCGSSTIFRPDIPIDVKTNEFRSHLAMSGC